MPTVKQLSFNVLDVNTYFIYDNQGECVVIDAGCHGAECERFAQFVSDNNLKIRYLLNTHLHFDHVLGNAFVAKTYGVAPMAHALDEFLLGEVAEIAAKLGTVVTEASPALGGRLSQGDVVRCGDFELEVLHVPGHTPGHLAYYLRETGDLFCGDALFRGSIGRSDFPYGSHADLVSAIGSRILTLPDATRVHPGHAESSTVGFERANNPFLRKFRGE